MNSLHSAMYRAGFVRTRDNKVIGGVCSGIARRYNLDAWAVRVLFILAVVLIPGSPILVYPVLWVVMPGDEFTPQGDGGNQAGAAGTQDVIR